MKERLVGAVVLVGLIVALVPEMLSGPRREAETESAADGSVRTYTIDLAPAPAERSPSAAGAPSTPVAGVTAQPPVVAIPRDQAAASREEAPAGSADATSADREKPTATPTEAPARPAVAPMQPAERATDRAQATVRPQPAADSGWAVQLGSFASRDNAERLAADVRKGGYRAFVSRFESGRSVRYRVRVGPEAQRAQAEAVAQRLQRDGRQVSIVPHP